MRKGSMLKQFALAAGVAAMAFPAFAQSESGSGQAESVQAMASSQSVGAEYQQLPGSGAMEGTDRTGTTGPSGSRAFSPEDGAVDVDARMAKPAGDYAATDTDRDLAVRIRRTLQGDPELAPGTDGNLHIKVDNGAVMLRGQVVNARTKEQIGATVRAVAGVRSLDTHLLVVRR